MFWPTFFRCIKCGFCGFVCLPFCPFIVSFSPKILDRYFLIFSMNLENDGAGFFYRKCCSRVLSQMGLKWTQKEVLLVFWKIEKRNLNDFFYRVIKIWTLKISSDNFGWKILFSSFWPKKTQNYIFQVLWQIDA